MRLKIVVAIFSAVPIGVFAFSTGPPIKRTAVPVDGGADCSACHRTYAPANSDPRGSVKIDVGNYAPGVKQTIKVTVSHPEGLRWGFELTARMFGDQTKAAGTFAPNDVVQVKCDPTGTAPCNGALEFAEHRSAPRTDMGLGYTFEVEWTPPATDVGPVIFYASGNAANGDNNLTGDRIYTTNKQVTTCGFSAKPSITSVVNGGSFAAGAIAPNSMVTIFGNGFQRDGQQRFVNSSDFVNNSFPKSVSCLAVEIDGKRAPVTYADAHQINVQVPTSTNTGSVALKVLLNADQPNQVASDSSTVQLLGANPAFFTFNGKSIAAQVPNSSNIIANPAVVAGGAPAKPGDVVTLYGTGFGFTDPVYQAGELVPSAAKITAPFTVSIGGTVLPSGDILYAGLSPQSISGLYQFNVKIPASVSDGDIPVVIQIGSAKTQDGATIPVKK